MTSLTLSQGGRGRILAVDDDSFGRDSLAQILRFNGFEVLEASTGQEALDSLSAEPDLVLLDVQLPDTDGFEVCQKIKKNPATAIMPVLMISGVAVSSRDRIHGLEGGADAYLTKPCNPDELIAYINTLLRVRQFEEQAITAQKRAESERRLLQLVLDTLPVGVWVLGKSAETILANPVGRRIWEECHFGGFDKIENYRCYQHDTGRPIPAQESSVGRALAAGESSLNEVIDIECPDGSRKTIRNSVVPVREEDQSVIGAVAVNEDITEKLRLEARFLQAQKMDAFGQMAGGVAHDFNNLLTVIIGCSDILLERLTESGESRDLAVEIQKAGERAASLTRQLLAFSRKQVLAPRVLDLNAIILEIERMLRRIIGADIEFFTRLRPGLGAVRADPGQIEQVLFNLVVNARDAMPRGGNLTIETANIELEEDYRQTHGEVIRPGLYTLFAVSDSGVGMTKEVQARIFEPFYSTKGPGKGTGLGLATVYGIVQQSGGHIEVYSEVNQGTTIKIYLPHSTAPAAPRPSGPKPSRFPTGTETILLVEDDAEVRALSEHILKASGYRLLTAASGDEAIRVFREASDSIHLLVSDVIMPGMAGPQLAQRLRRDRPDLKVLFLSGYTEDAVFRHGILEGKVNFLAKPFTPMVLAQKVRSVLDADLIEAPVDDIRTALEA